MVSIQISNENHEKLCAIRDEENLKSFNNVLDKLLPSGSVSGVDFEIEKPAFALIDTDESVLNVSWDELKKADVDDGWCNGESALIIHKDELGVLIRFIDNYDEIYLNYFHFL